MTRARRIPTTAGVAALVLALTIGAARADEQPCPPNDNWMAIPVFKAGKIDGYRLIGVASGAWRAAGMVADDLIVRTPDLVARVSAYAATSEVPDTLLTFDVRRGDQLFSAAVPATEAVAVLGRYFRESPTSWSAYGTLLEYMWKPLAVFGVFAALGLWSMVRMVKRASAASRAVERGGRSHEDDAGDPGPGA